METSPLTDITSADNTMAFGTDDSPLWRKEVHLDTSIVAPQSSKVLSGTEAALVDELEKIEAVGALFAERDSEGVLMVFVVVPEHEDQVYQAVLEAEERIADRVSDDTIELRVRAHQGRTPFRTVPVGSQPLFIR